MVLVQDGALGQWAACSETFFVVLVIDNAER